MNNTPTKQSLSPARQRLVELMQRINFGRIEGLLIRDREPVFDPAPRVVSVVKLAGENGARPEAAHADFLLKPPVVALLRHLDLIASGRIAIVVIQNGLPMHLEVDGLAA